MRRVVTVWAAASCTRYGGPTPVTPEAAPAGAHVRLTLTEAGSAALARTTAGAGVVGVEGTVAAAAADSVRLHPDRLLTASGVAVAWSGGDVTVARGDVRAVERRVTDRGRTVALVVGAAAVGAAFLVAVRRATGGDRGGGEGNPTPF